MSFCDNQMNINPHYGKTVLHPVSKRTTIYDAVYSALNFINTKTTYPITINKIATNPKVQKILLEKGLIKKIVREKDIMSKYQMYNYFIISSKGHEYLKRYEHLRDLLD